VRSPFRSYNDRVSFAVLDATRPFETKAVVALTGSAPRAGARHVPRSVRLPFVQPPTFVRAARRIAHVRVEAPETTVSIAVFDRRALRTAVGIARSLSPYPPADDSRAG
jgi:hypothetical protein